MPLLPVLLLRALKAATRAGGSVPSAEIIIRRPYAAPEEELRRAFQAQEDAQVIADRRAGEHRASRHPVAIERRLAVAQAVGGAGRERHFNLGEMP